jgi:hypothetical protein
MAKVKKGRMTEEVAKNFIKLVQGGVDDVAGFKDCNLLIEVNHK